MENKLKGHTKQTKDGITFSIDIIEVEKHPLKVAMKSLDLLCENLRIPSMGFKVSPELKSYMDKNKDAFEEESSKESKEFKKWSSLIFSALSGPLNNYPDTVFEKVNKIYMMEKFFNNIKEEKNIPQIEYTIKNFEIDIQNIQNLCKKFGKPVMHFTAVMFKEHLNHDYFIKNKKDDKPYKISTNIVSSLYNSKTKQHEYFENFSGKETFLSYALIDSVKKISKPEEILSIGLISDNLRKIHIENLDKSTENTELKKIKP